MAFLVGMGDEEPLRYRILPVNRFMNIGAAKFTVPCMHLLPCTHCSSCSATSAAGTAAADTARHGPCSIM